jgi:hypothetical protein
MPNIVMRNLSNRLRAVEEPTAQRAGSRKIRPHQRRPEKVVDRNLVVGVTTR